MPVTYLKWFIELMKLDKQQGWYRGCSRPFFLTEEGMRAFLFDHNGKEEQKNRRTEEQMRRK